MLIERIREIADRISNSEDLDCVEVIEDLIFSAGEYIKKVNAFEGGLIVAKYYTDGEEYSSYINSLNKEKVLALNELVANIKITNRLCKKYNIALVYIGDEEDREGASEFGMELCKEIFACKR
ncbi:hypothetical protein GCM10008905_33050 [Clostridium malenominatum]|uniref:CdaR GGDEF-like domain-containing protein n=1 Tax=Clostridium malenominatum TaxID=1539 RepID=A0ABP3UDG8_9CLOT